MDTLTTARLALPLLAPGQAHKEVFHNEALTLLDFLIHPVVSAIENDPASLTPIEGECWLVGTFPVGEWADHANRVAGWSAGGWRYFEPLQRMEIYILSDDSKTVFRNDAWETPVSIPGPSGGGIVDGESRAAIDSILTTLQLHGILPSQA